MFYNRLNIFFFLLLLASCSAPKQLAKSDTQTLEKLQKHIQYLADDKLEGRRTGTAGEEKAVDYIVRQFKAYNISPKGTVSYTQSFNVNEGKEIASFTSLIINGDSLQVGKQFFPFPYSKNVTLEAVPVIAIQEAEVPWFFDLKDVLAENKTNPHFDLQDYIRTNAKKAGERGASAVVLYNSSSINDNLTFVAKDRSDTLAIPVLYVYKDAAKKYFADIGAPLKIRMTVHIDDIIRIGNNVIGFIDNKAPTTIILGAHFDHLGYGEDGNSMIRNLEQPTIHNGADDNASGTAALLELARKLKSSRAVNNNYLFIAFSGEELGLYGSKYFTENSTIDLNTVNYMINMDMVGRLNDSSKTITVGGYGTSPAWGNYYNTVSVPARTQELQFKFDSSGTGPSDHTSFYRKDIPVLFYFTGLHSDYHKPTDDADKINYKGEQLIISHILNLIESLDTKGKVSFLKTRETQTSTSARFSVSLGIMPDYTFTGTGVRADGISNDKAAHKAGLKEGDIIIQMGKTTITSLENYMQALSTYKKGDKTTIKFKRGKDTKEVTVEF